MFPFPSVRVTLIYSHPPPMIPHQRGRRLILQSPSLSVSLVGLSHYYVRRVVTYYYKIDYFGGTNVYILILSVVFPISCKGVDGFPSTVIGLVKSDNAIPLVNELTVGSVSERI